MNRVLRAAVDPGNIVAGAVLNVVVALPGVTRGDVVTAIPPLALEAGLVLVTTDVHDEDACTIRLFNPTAGAIDGASLVWSFLVQRVEGG